MAFVATFSTGGESPVSLRGLSGLAQSAELRLGEESYQIIGRIRLDRRGELISRLNPRFLECDPAATDADLCLRAYAVWGDDFINHIHGDFAFALWDDQRRQLFCARDRLGVRTLTYLECGGVWWVSDSLSDLIAASGFVGQALDQVWIKDFLANGFCDDPSRTVYACAHRLLPGHTLTIATERTQIYRFWQLEVAEPLFLKSTGDYLERFHALLGDSIHDRMPVGKVGVLMSGGLDSSTLAAKTVELNGSADRVIARTWLVCSDLDPEDRASRLVAQHLGIQQVLIDGDQLNYDPDWRVRPAEGVEPTWADIYPAARRADQRAMEQQATCWFYGEGPDNALTFEWQAYLNWLAKRSMWSRLPKTVMTYLGTKSLKEWNTTLGVWSGRKQVVWPTPDLSWIRDSGSGVVPSDDSDDASSWRPHAFKSFRGGQWPFFLEALDSEYASTAIDWRHPYLELSLLEFMLSTPPIPWGRRKRLIRSAMKSSLPLEILERDKTPLYHDTLADKLRHNPPIMPSRGAKITEFIDIERLPSSNANFMDPYALLRVSILDHWLNTRNA